MINDAQVCLAGYVASPPSFKFAGGKPATTVRVAFTPRWISRDTGEWADGPTSFVNVLCWRALAGNVAVSLRKGEPVLVMGRLRVRRYQDKEGAMRIAVEVEAQSIGHDLTRGVAAFSRTRRAPGGTALEAAEALRNGAASADVEQGGREGPVGSSDAAGAASELAGLTGAGLADTAVPDGASLVGGADRDSAAAEDGEELDDELDENVVARFAQEMGGSVGEAAAPA